MSSLRDKLAVMLNRFAAQPSVGAGCRTPTVVAPALVVLALVSGCGEPDTGTGRPTENAAPTSADVTSSSPRGTAAAVAFGRRGAMIAGWSRAASMRADDDCVPGMRAGEFECPYGRGDGMESSWIGIRVQPDGTATKVLAFAKPRTGAKSPAEVERLLARDDREMSAPARVGDYTCLRSPRIEPDGRPSDTDANATGDRCTTVHRIDHEQHVRYVEFAADGTALRDYEIPRR